MKITNDIISQFAKNNETSKHKKETFVYGKLSNKIDVRDDGSLKYYVVIDGSEIETPVSHFTATVNPDERVIIMIKNRSAIITGNISSASASSNYVDTQIDEKIKAVGVIPTDYITDLWEGYFNE